MPDCNGQDYCCLVEDCLWQRRLQKKKALSPQLLLSLQIFRVGRLWGRVVPFCSPKLHTRVSQSNGNKYFSLAPIWPLCDKIRASSLRALLEFHQQALFRRYKRAGEPDNPVTPFICPLPGAKL